MVLIWIALATYAVQWFALPFIADQWTFLLGAECLTIALLVTGIWRLESGRGLLIRSVLTLWMVGGWGDVVKFVAWGYCGTHLNLSAPMALVFAVWLLAVLNRKYDLSSGRERFDVGNVLLLVKRPESGWDVVKALFGSPAASVCLSAYGKVWAFRRRTGVFELLDLHDPFLARHWAIDTGVPANLDFVRRITAVVGTPRGFGYKCVWAIRGPLNSLGGKYAIKSWIDYIPGMYIMRIL